VLAGQGPGAWPTCDHRAGLTKAKGGWRGLWKLNKTTLKNPNRSYIGQLLRVR
jgi:hypothetical protein